MSEFPKNPTERQIRRQRDISSVIGALGQITARPVLPTIERPEAAQLDRTMQTGWDSDGIYHD